MTYFYGQTTLFSSITVTTFDLWQPTHLASLLATIDDAECEAQIKAWAERDRWTTVQVAAIGSVVIGYIYKEAPDFFTLRDWVDEFENTMNSIAEDYERETTWYFEDQIILAELAQVRREQGR